jgi:hypothetical protein
MPASLRPPHDLNSHSAENSEPRRFMAPKYIQFWRPGLPMNVIRSARLACRGYARRTALTRAKLVRTLEEFPHARVFRGGRGKLRPRRARSPRNQRSWFAIEEWNMSEPFTMSWRAETKGRRSTPTTATGKCGLSDRLFHFQDPFMDRPDGRTRCQPSNRWPS